MLPLAKKYRDYLTFTIVDATEYPEMVQALGLQAGATRALSVQNPSNGNVFPYTGNQEISLPVVERFLIDIIEGRIKPWQAQSGQQRSQTGAVDNLDAVHDEL